MRIHVFSDLHLEFGSCEFSQEVRSGELAELVLLPGDIHVKRRGPAWAGATFSQPIVMLGGNHESYSDSLYASIAANRKNAAMVSQARSTAVRFLERETFKSSAIDGTPFRIVAATLWTDFDLFGSERQALAINAARRDSNDFEHIRILDSELHEKRRFGPMDALRLHRESRAFLEAELSTPFDGITIVMSHHAPSCRSLPEKFAAEPLSAAYASDLEDLIQQTQPLLWVHGHLHNSSDCMIGQTRVVCNPRGYYPSELNKSFDPAFVVEI